MNRFSSRHPLSFALFAALLLPTGCANGPKLSGGGGGTGTSGGSGTGGGGTETNTLTPGGASSVYAFYDGGFTVTSTPKTLLQFPATSTGAISPSATLSMPALFVPSTVTIDSTGQIYVGGTYAAPTTVAGVLVYAAGATGTATPIRAIVGSFPALAAPTRIAVDSSGLLYVAFGNMSPGIFEVFSATASGGATPLRTITGPLTQMANAPIDLRVDRSGNIYVVPFVSSTSDSKVLIFSPTADGNVAPTRILTGSSTTFSSIFAIDLDSNDNLYVLNELAGAPITSTILEFPASATGNVAPMRTIAGTNTGLGAVKAIRVDSVGNIYVLGIEPASATGTPHVAAFSSTATGNIAPAITFTSAAWPVSDNYDFAVR